MSKTSSSYVVTKANGEREVYPNVQNVPSFMKAMTGSGRTVARATPAVLREAGIEDNPATAHAARGTPTMRAISRATASALSKGLAGDDDQDEEYPDGRFPVNPIPIMTRRTPPAPTKRAPTSRAVLTAAVDAANAKLHGRPAVMGKKGSKLRNIVEADAETRRPKHSPKR